MNDLRVELFVTNENARHNVMVESKPRRPIDMPARPPDGVSEADIYVSVANVVAVRTRCSFLWGTDFPRDMHKLPPRQVHFRRRPRSSDRICHRK